MKRYGSKGSQIISQRNAARIKNSGKTLIAQKIGIIEDKPIINLVIKETLESSSHSPLLNVVNLHAKDAKLRTEIIGVIMGKTKIKRI